MMSEQACPCIIALSRPCSLQAGPANSAAQPLTPNFASLATLLLLLLMNLSDIRPHQYMTVLKGMHKAEMWK